MNVKVDQCDVHSLKGRSLLDTYKKAGIFLKNDCGGKGTCGTCLIEVIHGAENLSPMGFTETALLQTLSCGDKVRLACQSLLKGSVEVKTYGKNL